MTDIQETTAEISVYQLYFLGIVLYRNKFHTYYVVHVISMKLY